MKTNPSPVVAAVLVSAAAWLVHPAFAADPPEQGWHARWIGPVLSGSPQLDLNGASWIWADEPDVDATRNAPQGARFFRRDITLPAGREGLRRRRALRRRQPLPAPGQRLRGRPG
jgi:hypothetical protein